MTKVQIGDKAPTFTGLDQHGNKIALQDFKGQKVALYFYPKDSTPGCTVQACNLRDNNTLLTDRNIAVLGVSADSVISHAKFSTKHQLNFSIIADTEHIILKQYGVWGEKKFMGRTYDGIHRTTFLIDENLFIIGRIDKPNTKNHAEEILKLID